MPTAEDIKQRIEAAIPGAQADVEDYTGGGDHFRATVVSPAFAGRSRIEQHKLVYGVFGEEIGGAIHALSLKTQTPEPASTSHVGGHTEGTQQTDAGKQQAAPAATTSAATTPAVTTPAATTSAATTPPATTSAAAT